MVAKSLQILGGQITIKYNVQAEENWERKKAHLTTGTTQSHKGHSPFCNKESQLAGMSGLSPPTVANVTSPSSTASDCSGE